ncbi:hypothetical protein RvY_15508 [Ramazzottius varieornatus]|uniref:Tc1-like transposase DDE domain-containing protein n=1 Tax=Ramazzottius varieornatus TaxID=947166 RepID=A0A1D1VV78_RAMVA|nr:hypothetical protein RvY_15508 [Ramazzottius varieornatus]
MLWGAITACGPVALIRVDGRIDSGAYEVLFERLLPYLEKHGRDLVFQQDKCLVHTSRRLGQFFWREGIEVRFLLNSILIFLFSIFKFTRADQSVVESSENVAEGC